MPREPIETDIKLEKLSVLDAEGEADADLDPGLDDELLLKMHRAMMLSRRFDQRMLELQRQGRIGTFAPVEGQEAAQIGAVSCIDDSDWMIPAFRETAAQVWRGIPLDGMLLFNAGYNEGGAIPDDQNTLPIAIPVASQLPHAVGIAYALKRQGDRVALTFFGDGATSEGDFHEAMNFAGVLETPTVFVCQNNGWAISVPRDRQTASATLAQKAIGFGMPGLQVDGNDVLGVRLAVSEAVARARAGDGPTLIECVTYRMGVHTTADDPSRYRQEEDVKAWRDRDPIHRLQVYLQAKDLLSDSELDALEDEIEDEIDKAWTRTEKRISELGAPEDMFDCVFAEAPPHIQAQRDRVAGKD